MILISFADIPDLVILDGLDGVGEVLVADVAHHRLPQSLPQRIRRRRPVEGKLLLQRFRVWRGRLRLLLLPDRLQEVGRDLDALSKFKFTYY